MSGTHQGGLKARDKNLANNPDYYSELGILGGRRRVSKGFSKMTKEKHSAASRKGGQISRKPKYVSIDGSFANEIGSKWRFFK